MRNAITNPEDMLNVAVWPFERAMKSLFSKEMNNLWSGDKSLIVRVKEEQDSFMIFTEVPGLTEENLSVKYENGVISVEAQYQEQDDTCQCIRSGKYSWSEYIPAVNGEKVEATLNKGILKITLPKSETAKARTIKIN